MSVLLDDVANYLEGNGISKAYVGYLPSDRDDSVSLFETGGYPRDTLDGDTETTTFQLRVRGGAKNAYQASRLSWQTCFDLLQDAQATGPFLPGVIFIQAFATGPLAWNDANGRPNFTSNFKCNRYKS